MADSLLHIITVIFYTAIIGWLIYGIMMSVVIYMNYRDEKKLEQEIKKRHMS